MAAPLSTTYTHEQRYEITANICAVIASTSLSVKDAITEAGYEIAAGTFWRWRFLDPKLDEMYARAKEEQTEVLADEMLEIADADNADVYIHTNNDGTKVARIDGEAMKRSQIRIDTRKWLAAKLKRKRFGDSVDITSDGKALNNGTPVDRADRAIELLKRVEGRAQSVVIDSRLDDLLR